MDLPVNSIYQLECDGHLMKAVIETATARMYFTHDWVQLLQVKHGFTYNRTN